MASPSKLASTVAVEILKFSRLHLGALTAVPLRLRVVNDYQGLQALQRCSGLLNRRARSITVATRHFADVAQQRQQQFCKLPGIAPRECESLRRPHFASVVKL